MEQVKQDGLAKYVTEFNDVLLSPFLCLFAVSVLVPGRTLFTIGIFSILIIGISVALRVSGDVSLPISSCALSFGKRAIAD